MDTNAHTVHVVICLKETVIFFQHKWNAARGSNFIAKLMDHNLVP